MNDTKIQESCSESTHSNHHALRTFENTRQSTLKNNAIYMQMNKDPLLNAIYLILNWKEN